MKKVTQEWIVIYSDVHVTHGLESSHRTCLQTSKAKCHQYHKLCNFMLVESMMLYILIVLLNSIVYYKHVYLYIM